MYLLVFKALPYFFASALIIALAERQLLRHEGRPTEPAVLWRNMVQAGIGNINIGALHNYCIILSHISDFILSEYNGGAVSCRF